MSEKGKLYMSSKLLNKIDYDIDDIIASVRFANKDYAVIKNSTFIPSESNNKKLTMMGIVNYIDYETLSDENISKPYIYCPIYRYGRSLYLDFPYRKGVLYKMIRA